MKKKLLSIIFVSLILSSCKKADTNSNNNNTGYYSKQLNQNITIGTGDVSASAKINIGNEFIGVSIFYNSTDSYGFYINDPDFGNSKVYLLGTSDGLNVYNTNDIINNSLYLWMSVSIFGYEQTTSGIEKNTIPPGSGDKYIGFKISDYSSSTVKNYFGWLLLNYSTDKKTITIKEYAYNKTANEQIKVGQK